MKLMHSIVIYSFIFYTLFKFYEILNMAISKIQFRKYKFLINYKIILYKKEQYIVLVNGIVPMMCAQESPEFFVAESQLRE